MTEKKYLYWLALEESKPIRFDELPLMIAKAIHPKDEMAWAFATIQLEAELKVAVHNGELTVLNPLTLGPHTFPHGESLKRAVLLPHDLTPLLDARGIGLRIVEEQADVKTPDWEYWRAMRKAQEWQACALSLNIDPDSMKHHSQAWMAGPDSGPLFTPDSFPSNDVQVKFEKRLRLLRANRYDRAIFTLPMAQYSGLGPNDVLLSEFAAWGLSIAWNDMPPELVAIAKTVSLPLPAHPQSVQPSPAVSAEEWEALVEQEEEARQDPAYKAKYDRAMSLYAERDKLLEHVRQDHPHQDPETKKRLSEIRREIAESEAGLSEVTEAIPSAVAPDIEKENCAGTENTWDEYNLRRLWDEYKEPGMTHQKLAAKYAVTRQRIGSLLVKAKEQFGPRKADPFSQLNPCNRKK